MTIPSVPIPVQLPLFAFERTCTICGLTKPITDFTPNKASRYGHMTHCRMCRNERARNRHAADPDKRRQRRNAYRREHPAVRERERVYEEAAKQQHNQRQRERYAADRERYLASARAYRAQNPEKGRQYARTWRVAHPEAQRAAVQRWNRANRERVLAIERAWRHAHPDWVREKNRRYRRANPAAVVAMTQRRRARHLGAEGSFSAREWRALCDFYERACLCCGATDRVLAADHVQPLSRGGTNYIFNLQPLCQPCNSAKGTKDGGYRTRSFGDFLDYLEAYPYRRRPKHRLLSVRSMADEAVGHQS